MVAVLELAKKAEKKIPRETMANPHKRKEKMRMEGSVWRGKGGGGIRREEGKTGEKEREREKEKEKEKERERWKKGKKRRGVKRET